jgi:hypothetical protein
VLCVGADFDPPVAWLASDHRGAGGPLGDSDSKYCTGIACSLSAFHISILAFPWT